jgi:hypothetical protein
MTYWPVRRQGGSNGKELRSGASGVYQMLGLPRCCLRPMSISQWVCDHKSYHSQIPVFVCQQCCSVGLYETLGQL